jgi:hypothetical protein
MIVNNRMCRWWSMPRPYTAILAYPEWISKD